MKTIADVAKGISDSMKYVKEILCDHLWGPGEIIQLTTPILSTEYACEYCGGREHHCPVVDPNLSGSRMWMCSNFDCEVHQSKKTVQATYIEAPFRRALEWPLFCEINGIGDVYADIKFEDLQQDAKKKSFLLQFASKPHGIVLMQGEAGLGKTYASLAVCELFTRYNHDALFFTQKTLTRKWLEVFKEERPSGLIQRVENCCLLVIDDFATSEPSPGFLAFFMDVINTRMQWKSRGTIISTNLASDKLSDFCGEALMDRLRTGQRLSFTGKSKRGHKPI